MSTLCLDPQALTPGTVVSILRHFVVPYRHFGIVSDRTYGGLPMVISNSNKRGGVVEEPWEEFTEKAEVTIADTKGNLPPHVVVMRARSKIGTTYNLLRWNCEHFVRDAHGLPAISPQVIFGIAALITMIVTRA